MPSLCCTIEAILFVAGHPLTEATLARYAHAQPLEVHGALEQLRERYQSEQRGIQLLEIGSSWQLVSHPDCAESVYAFAKEEVLGELTRAQLETLSVIAYRGPLPKRELDAIRGVNCRQIIRNLLIRGLVEVEGEDAEAESGEDDPQSYQVSPAFLRHLGLTALEQLPEYGTLRASSVIDDVIEKEASV